VNRIYEKARGNFAELLLIINQGRKEINSETLVRGVLNKIFIREGSAPRSNPYPFIHHF